MQALQWIKNNKQLSKFLKIIFNIEMITQFKCIFKSKKLFQYNEKSICEHINYSWNCIRIFQLIFKKFQMKNFKIIFVIQILIDELKKSWYYFKKNHFDHWYTFKNYSNFLLTFIENSMNHQFHFVQFFNDVKQSKKQLIHVFDIYFNSLKIQFLLLWKNQNEFIFSQN